MFVPADSERKLAKSASLPADALVFDLEDAVLPARKPEARRLLAEFLPTFSGGAQVWVRVNDISSGETLADIAAVAPLAPAGIVLPKVRGPEDLAAVSHWLSMAEAMAGLPPTSLGLIAVITETPAAVLRLGEMVREPWPRLRGVMWGAEDLSSALGAGDPRRADGSWHDTYGYARSQALLAAHALGVQAIDTVFVDFRDSDGCASHARQARSDGFTGKVAIHPAQIEVINAAFTPGAEEIAWAQRVVAAFADGAGAVALDGKMLDIPHLKAAQRLLEVAHQV